MIGGRIRQMAGEKRREGERGEEFMQFERGRWKFETSD